MRLARKAWLVLLSLMYSSASSSLQQTDVLRGKFSSVQARGPERSAVKGKFRNRLGQVTSTWMNERQEVNDDDAGVRQLQLEIDKLIDQWTANNTRASTPMRSVSRSTAYPLSPSMNMLPLPVTPFRAGLFRSSPMRAGSESPMLNFAALSPGGFDLSKCTDGLAQLARLVDREGLKELWVDPNGNSIFEAVSQQILVHPPLRRQAEFMGYTFGVVIEELDGVKLWRIPSAVVKMRKDIASYLMDLADKQNNILDDLEDENVDDFLSRIVEDRQPLGNIAKQVMAEFWSVPIRCLVINETGLVQEYVYPSSQQGEVQKLKTQITLVECGGNFWSLANEDYSPRISPSPESFYSAPSRSVQRVDDGAERDRAGGPSLPTAWHDELSGLEDDGLQRMQQRGVWKQEQEGQEEQEREQGDTGKGRRRNLRHQKKRKLRSGSPRSPAPVQQLEGSSSEGGSQNPQQATPKLLKNARERVRPAGEYVQPKMKTPDPPSEEVNPEPIQEVTSAPPQVDRARASEEEKERESSRQAAMLQGFMQLMQERDGQRDQMISQMQNQTGKLMLQVMQMMSSNSKQEEKDSLQDTLKPLSDSLRTFKEELNTRLNMIEEKQMKLQQDRSEQRRERLPSPPQVGQARESEGRSRESRMDVQAREESRRDDVREKRGRDRDGEDGRRARGRGDEKVRHVRLVEESKAVNDERTRAKVVKGEGEAREKKRTKEKNRSKKKQPSEKSTFVDDDKLSINLMHAVPANSFSPQHDKFLSAGLSSIPPAPAPPVPPLYPPSAPPPPPPPRGYWSSLSYLPPWARRDVFPPPSAYSQYDSFPAPEVSKGSWGWERDMDRRERRSRTGDLHDVEIEGSVGKRESLRDKRDGLPRSELAKGRGGARFNEMTERAEGLQDQAEHVMQQIHEAEKVMEEAKKKTEEAKSMHEALEKVQDLRERATERKAKLSFLKEQEDELKYQISSAAGKNEGDRKGRHRMQEEEEEEEGKEDPTSSGMAHLLQEAISTIKETNARNKVLEEKIDRAEKIFQQEIFSWEEAMRRDLDKAVPLDKFRATGAGGGRVGGRRGFLSPESFEPPQAFNSWASARPFLPQVEEEEEARERSDREQETKGRRSVHSKEVPSWRTGTEEEWVAGDELVSSASQDDSPLPPRKSGRDHAKIASSSSMRYRKLPAPRGLSELLANAGLSGYEKLLVRNGWDSLSRVQLMAEEDLMELGVKKGHARAMIRALKGASS
ncbi:hypothetical protein GUITHDRAFT_132322 [Guillardia theta CCMP2712]|uniref:SAM domain-containing protein n=2 Tax=Guillardia theta TaxID=55529 RepID=L1K2E6_GUITC|nr:hypothetical protein GUITHDRAFT_132322 [Guillardia theta CCMP2712]EKX54630.1 hypothetical protein GUITHDRAFT_132322 [Guillardia theta CCMP2712]|eukprot:XP_005841610.1 hypothetical protein GUITHDRAFT_132322 [Guillardia theta CCMP2712]